MSTYIKTEENGALSYENQPEEKLVLFKNEKPLTVEDVENIIISFLSSVGVEITENAVTVNKSLLVQNELEPDKKLPVLLSDAGIRRINLMSAFPGALVVRGKFGSDTTSDKIVTVQDPS